MKRILCLILCVLITISFLSACNKKTDAGSTDENTTSSYNLDEIGPELVEANSGFAFDIFRELNKEDADSNIFISPLSISTALAMAWNGAGTTTKEAMSKTLGYEGMDLNAVNESYKNLIGYLTDADKKVELNIGNSIWIKKGEAIKQDFIKRNRDYFNAEVDSIDFLKDNAADIINNWISDATKGKIDKMLTPPISPQVVMYLINAIYFKGEWAKQFDPEKTFDSQFSTAWGDKKTVDMMSRKGKAEYGTGEGFKVVRLPYGSEKIAMHCVLPDEGTAINDFIASMDRDMWDEIREIPEETEDVILQIPKFKMEYGIKNLNDSLKALGMSVAFSDMADFTGIRDSLLISRVLHKAVVEVNEEGSEAAGATVAEIKLTAAPADSPVFIADRPFVFFITDQETGSILFMGKACDLG